MIKHALLHRETFDAVLTKKIEAQRAEVDRLEADHRKSVAAIVEARKNPGATVGGLGSGKHVFAKRLEARERLRALQATAAIFDAIFEEMGR